MDESLECVFATASSVKSIVMKSEEMNANKTELEDLITQAEVEIELNPAECIVVGNVEKMKQLKKSRDGHYKNCLQKFGELMRVYDTVLEALVETAQQAKNREEV